MKITVPDIITATHGKLANGPLSTEIRSISTDSRTSREGDLFIALKGPNFDGSDFIPIALEKGIGGILSANMPDRIDLPDDIFYIKVENAEWAMGDLAAWWRRECAPRTICVMGSSGKTTTREILSQLSPAEKSVVSTHGNFNNTIGLPLTLFGLEIETDYAIVEIGMNTRGEMKRLSEIADPDILVVTNIGMAHAGMFPSHEDLVRAKAEVFESIRNNCVLIINSDCKFTPKFQEYARYEYKRLTYGFSEEADYRALNPRILADGTYRFDLIAHGETIRDIHLPFVGKYNIYNALAAIAAYSVLEENIPELCKRLSELNPINMRSEILKWNGTTIISDCYNANPDSMTAALQALASFPRGKRRFALLGSMLELGKDTEYFHKETGKEAVRANLSLLITFGEEAFITGKEAAKSGVKHFHVTRHEEAAEMIKKNMEPGDILLVKGSRKMKLEKVIDILKNGMKP